MNKAFIRVTLCLIVVSLVFLPAIVIAQPVEDQPLAEEREKLPISDIVQKLGLTPEQKEQLKEQRFQERYNRIDTRNKIRLKELELRYELEKTEVNRETVSNIVAELKQLQGITLEQRVDSILRMKKILTPEQFEKLQYCGKQRLQRSLQGRRSKFQGYKQQ
jgi:Spy/CpxP family protein refolding chaperone